MNIPVAPTASGGTSTRPYLIRALHEWCTDNGFTPYLAVFVGSGVKVPEEYVKNNEIVLNISFEATTALRMGNEAIEFKARFGGVAREIYVPVDHVIAIYARENGQGMAFPAPSLSNAAAPAKPGPAEVSGDRGLRLATSGSATADAPRKDPATDAPRMDPATDDPDTPPPGAPTPGRPSLKRIK